MNPYALLVLFFTLGQFFLEWIVEALNLGNLSSALPAEFQGFYEAEKYAQSQNYLREQTRFGLFENTVKVGFFLAFWFLGGFQGVDSWARSFGFGEIRNGLLFVGALSVLSQILQLPFAVYHTFWIEQKFGFNKTTWQLFIMDRVKGAVLGAVLGGLVFSGILWFFEVARENAWLYAWIFLSAVQVLLMWLAPTLIMPLFNKFTPLPVGELRAAIEAYAKAQNFNLQEIFTMDGSKRSAKSNAFFTGFGKFKKIVLFDTLVEKQTVEELVAILAHEIGHYKKRHVLRFLVLSIVMTGVSFYFLSLFLNHPGIFEAFRVQQVSVYASLVFVSFLYSPVGRVVSIGTHILSRKYEFEADRYSVDTFSKPEVMANALKKLSVENFSNLTPHPLKVFLEYTHPPVMERIKALRLLKTK